MDILLKKIQFVETESKREHLNGLIRRIQIRKLPKKCNPPSMYPISHPEKHPDDWSGKSLQPSRSSYIPGHTDYCSGWRVGRGATWCCKALVVCVCLKEPQWPCRSDNLSPVSSGLTPQTIRSREASSCSCGLNLVNSGQVLKYIPFSLIP